MEMTRKSRRNHGAEFKAQVVLGGDTLSELSEQFEVHPTQIARWKHQLLERTGEVFGGPSRNETRRWP